MNSIQLFLLKLFWSLLDTFTPKNKNYWCFSTHYIQTDIFKDNQRALFEFIKADPNIKKIIVYRGSFKNNIEDAKNTEIVRHGSLRFFLLLARAKIVFLSNSISMDYSFRFENSDFSILKISGKNRILVNLWHGIPLKGLYYTANPKVGQQLDKISYRKKERKSYSGLVASSNIDSYAMAASFYPLSYDKVWITGLPRNDFLQIKEESLPSYLISDILKIRQLRQGKKMVIYAPTYRQVSAVNEASYYQFSADEINQLKKVLQHHNAILGYRPHYFKNSDEYFNFLDYIDDKYFFDMSVNVIDDFSMIAREMDVLITDYSSVFMDAIYLDKPVIGFTYDLTSYQHSQDGLLYSMEQAFPGKTCQQFTEVIDELSRLLSKQKQIDITHIKNLFYQYNDSRNSERVFKKTIEEINKESH